MLPALSEPHLSRLRELLAVRMGIRFSGERSGLLERALHTVAGELGFPDADAFVRGFLSAPVEGRHLEALAAHVTIGETYFFREPRSFAVLESHLLPTLIQSRRARDRRLRIWSAGCATGEEPYSIAVLLRKLIPDIAQWKITILGTDINPGFLSRARRGVYTQWSFRGVPDWVRAGCFRQHEQGRLELLPEIREMVSFSHLNLAEDPYPSLMSNTNAMDLIFCRNVLMYFTPQAARHAVENFTRCLVEGGCLIVSPVETSATLFAPLASTQMREVTVYVKSGTGAVQSRGAEWSAVASTPASQPLAPDHRIESGRIDALPDDSRSVAESEARSVEAKQPEEFDELLALFENGDYMHAIERVLEAAAGVPANPRFIEIMVRSCANIGRLEEAADWCRRLIAIDRLDARPHFLLGSIQQEAGLASDAVESMNRALYLDPSFVLAHFALGNMGRARGRNEEADRHFSNALRILRQIQPADLLPESDGMTAGRLAEIIEALSSREMAA